MVKIQTEILKRAKNCMLCEEKIPKGTRVVNIVSSVYNSHAHHRAVCEKCLVETLFFVSGKKFLKPKVIKELQMELVAREV